SKHGNNDKRPLADWSGGFRRLIPFIRYGVSAGLVESVDGLSASGAENLRGQARSHKGHIGVLCPVGAGLPGNGFARTSRTRKRGGALLPAGRRAARAARRKWSGRR